MQEDYKYYNITSTSAVSSTARPSLYDEDDEKSKLLQKLLRSNKPNDLKAANHLIKTMVKEVRFTFAITNDTSLVLSIDRLNLFVERRKRRSSSDFK